MNAITARESVDRLGYRAVSATAARPAQAAKAVVLALPLTRSIDQATVVPMEVVTLSQKFQIVIPKQIREGLGLHSGQKLRMMVFKNRIQVIPVKDIREYRGFVKGINTTMEEDAE